jgi:hypothetical protein
MARRLGLEQAACATIATSGTGMKLFCSYLFMSFVRMNLLVCADMLIIENLPSLPVSGSLLWVALTACLPTRLSRLSCLSCLSCLFVTNKTPCPHKCPDRGCTSISAVTRQRQPSALLPFSLLLLGFLLGPQSPDQGGQRGNPGESPLVVQSCEDGTGKTRLSSSSRPSGLFFSSPSHPGVLLPHSAAQ